MELSQAERIHEQAKRVLVVVFSAPGPTRSSVLALAEELSGYGAHLLLIENGALRSLDESAAEAGDEESPIFWVMWGPWPPHHPKNRVPPLM